MTKLTATFGNIAKAPNKL